MRILVVSRHPVYPPLGGAPLRNWQNISILSSFATVGVFEILLRNSPRTNGCPPGINYFRSIHGHSVAETRSTLYKVAKRLWWLRPRGHWYADDYYSGWVARELESAIADFQPDIILLEEPWLHQYFKVFEKSKAKLIYDAHNIEYPLSQQIQRGIKKPFKRLDAVIQSIKVKAIEKYIFDRVHEIWVCSEEDALLLKELYVIKVPVKTIPNGIDTDFYRDVWNGKISPPEQVSKDSPKLIFVGSFDYKPNSRAAEVLIRDIFPKLQLSYPNCHLLLVGTSPTQFMRQASHKNSCIHVTGRVADIRPYLSTATVSVIPLREGGGTRLKILESFAAGCPVVTSSKGIEGIDAVPGRDFLLAETIEKFVEEIDKLLQDKDRRQQLRKSAHDLVLENYSWNALNRKIRNLF